MTNEKWKEEFNVLHTAIKAAKRAFGVYIFVALLAGAIIASVT